MEEGVNPNLDVVLYQGTVAKKYSGYYKYQDLVKEKEQTYASANNSDKRLIAQSIVDTVTNTGGRYLQRIKIDGKTFYNVLGNKAALEKTAKALKEARYARERRTGAASLLALANAAQPAAANAPPPQAPSSLSIDTNTGPDIIHVRDFIDLTRSD